MATGGRADAARRGSMLALGLVCGAVAYLLYFRLIADIGATGALTVTYLIPVFGVLWGRSSSAKPVTLPCLPAPRSSSSAPSSS